MLSYKHTAYVFANIVLLLVYACWFGQQSIRRYLDDAVYIIQQEEKPATINPPVFDIFPQNPQSGKGWKDDNLMQCGSQSGQDFINCIEQIAYNTNDIIGQVRHYSNDSFKINPYFTSLHGAIGQSLKVSPGVITHGADIGFSIYNSSSLGIALNATIPYVIGINDPKLAFASLNPFIVSRTVFRLQRNAGEVTIFLKAIKHEKLDRPDNLCNHDSSYSFADCVQKSIMVKAGCQPPWRLVSVQNLPLCDNLNMLLQYNSIFVRLVYYGRNKLIEATKCLMPCTYMEYKMAEEDPVVFPYPDTTSFVPIFSSDSVPIMKEAEAFSLVSLMADIGGVLGLFIGFNFLMVYEWVVFCYEKLSPRWQYNTRRQKIIKYIK